MNLSWHPFKISLKDFKDWLEGEVLSSDGLVACEQHLEIVERIPFTSADKAKIEEQYKSLTEEGEAAKLNRPQMIESRLQDIKRGMISKQYEEMTILERKIILGMPITEEEVLKG